MLGGSKSTQTLKSIFVSGGTLLACACKLSWPSWNKFPSLAIWKLLWSSFFWWEYLATLWHKLQTAEWHVHVAMWNFLDAQSVHVVSCCEWDIICGVKFHFEVFKNVVHLFVLWCVYLALWKFVWPSHTFILSIQKFVQRIAHLSALWPVNVAKWRFLDAKSANAVSCREWK